MVAMNSLAAALDTTSRLDCVSLFKCSHTRSRDKLEDRRNEAKSDPICKIRLRVRILITNCTWCGIVNRETSKTCIKKKKKQKPHVIDDYYEYV